MSEFNQNNQNTNGYQPPQYTQPYPPQNGYQPPRYTQQVQQPVYNAPPPPVYPVVQGFPQKSRLAAAILAFMFGYLGVHNFYLGNTGKGVGQLVLGVLGSALCGLGTVASMIWSISEGIKLLKDEVPADGHGMPFID